MLQYPNYHYFPDFVWTCSASKPFQEKMWFMQSQRRFFLPPHYFPLLCNSSSVSHQLSEWHVSLSYSNSMLSSQLPFVKWSKGFPKECQMMEWHTIWTSRPIFFLQVKMHCRYIFQRNSIWNTNYHIFLNRTGNGVGEGPFLKQSLERSISWSELYGPDPDSFQVGDLVVTLEADTIEHTAVNQPGALNWA